MVEPSSFLTPLTFHASAHVIRETRSQDIIQVGCSNTHVSILTCAGLSNVISPEGLTSQKEAVLLGCDDGTVYVFGQTSVQKKNKSRRTSYIEKALGSGPPSPFHTSRGSYPASRSTSPSSSSTMALPPFNVSSRSRIVSGITTEAVEAPKNYVDFDEEPAKLKEMLQAKTPKDRSHTPEPSFSSSTLSPSTTVASPSTISSPHPSKYQREESRSRSASVLFQSKRAPSSPTSKSCLPPLKASPRKLGLRYHILPLVSGSACAITGLEFLHESSMFSVLRQNGDLCVYKTLDGSCLASMRLDICNLKPPAGMEEVEASYHNCRWKSMQILDFGESYKLLLIGNSAMDYSAYNPSADSDSNGTGEKCRLALVELQMTEDKGLFEVTLEKIGDWLVPSSTQSIGALPLDNEVILVYHVNAQEQLEIQSLKLEPPTYSASPVELQPTEPILGGVASLPLHNPFKALKSRSAERSPTSQEEPTRISVLDEYNVGTLLPEDSSVQGCKLMLVGSTMRGLVWNAKELTGFEVKDRSFQVLFNTPLSRIERLKWMDEEMFSVKLRDRYEVYGLDFVDGNGDSISDTSRAPHVQLQTVRIIQVGASQASEIVSDSAVVSTSTGADGRRSLEIWSPGKDASAEASQGSRNLWKATHSSPSTTPYLTATLPLEIDLIILGFSDGHIRQSSFARMTEELSPEQHFTAVSDAPLNGYLTGLHLALNGRTKERFIVGGADDGSIAFWSFDSLKLCARWTIFLTPLACVIQSPEEKGPLRGCALCIADDGTIAVVVIDGFQLLYIIPGSPWPLQRICLGGNDLLLIYANQMARLWDLKTREFWRSMNIDKAEELLGQRQWIELPLKPVHPDPEKILSSIPGTSVRGDGAATLLLNLERFVAESNAVTRSISTSRDQTRIIFSTLDRLRSILSTLLTWGLSDDIDGICRDKLGVPLASTLVGTSSGKASVSVYQADQPQDWWCISEEVSAARCLAITLVLKALAVFEEYSDAANTVILFYATSLATVVGLDYQPPSLSFLAQRWFDGSNEMRHAVRMLVDALITHLTDDETANLAEKWQHDLPCLQPTADRESFSSALALFLCGYLAAEKYSLLSTTLLTDISKSITLYLHDEQSIHRVLAIDLCSRGFQIWQHYVDAMEILRALFTLATTSRKDTITTQNAGAQARSAVLSIASSNTPLFMTTLGLDILNPGSVEYRKTVLQIVAFLIRKRPLVLYPNLPRLMEAVVKSLDPNSTASRDAVLDTATEIIGHVVKTFPTIDFHMASQRLAVGTSEGAIVMYDLKTAIRLYVLEGHKKRIAACSFSPDGRRLVTVSLEESVVLVWKVGTSFSSFFNPGAPPRQGNSGSLPFKTLSFNVGDEANMTIAATLEWVCFEWTADRSVKLKIRQSILTFST